jgi:bifunctional DNA-binding transcriptional regulator/antitoxin component of YhaV-PrlF toxin-antitoxin module
MDIARLDASGRFSARSLLGVLGWSPKDRVDLAVVGDAVVIGSSVTGRQVVGSRGDLAIPAPARSLAGLGAGHAVLLVAAPDQDLLVVHALAVIGRLLAEHYARQSGDDGAG